MSDDTLALEKMEDKLVSEVSGPKLIEYTKGISRWVRVSGTQDEIDSMKYISGILEGFGYKTQMAFHPAFISVPVKASLDLEFPEQISFECITHSFTTSTPQGGIIGELVLNTSPVIEGKIVLCKGMPSPIEVSNIQRFGAMAAIYIQDEYLHYNGISPLWGVPTEETEALIPSLPVVSVTRQDGMKLEGFLKNGRTRVRIETTIDTGWRDIPLLEAEISATGTDKFLLFSSHLDSWEYGAMDNGAANATLIEVARVLASKKELWRRGLRIAFWSGHSHGKFAGSSWYADHHFEELEKNCIGHVYADSTGGKDAVVINEVPVMPQSRHVVADVMDKQTGEQLVAKRIGHYADQSFYGIGLTSIFGTLSGQDPDKNRDVISFKAGSTGGLGWWWHTRYDTVDKVDEANLARDTKIYTATVWRLLTKPVLPYDFREAITEMEKTVRDLQEELRLRFDLNDLKERLVSLRTLLEDFYREIAGIIEPGEAADRANEKLMKLSNKIVRITFHDKNCFEYDLSGPMFPIPSLAKGSRLAKVSEKSNEYYMLITELQRGLNRVMHHLGDAMDILKD